MTKVLAIIWWFWFSLLVVGGWCQFPSDFVWGAATAAYQIEGAYQQDGRYSKSCFFESHSLLKRT